MHRRSCDGNGGSDGNGGFPRSRRGLLVINDFQFTGRNGIAMDERFPVHRVAVHQGAQAGAGVFDKVAAFPGLEAEMDGGQAKVGGNGNLVLRVRAHADAAFREQKGVALGSAEFSHGFKNN